MPPWYHPGQRQSYLDADYAQTPVTVAWEVTCAYALTGDYLAPDPSRVYQPNLFGT